MLKLRDYCLGFKGLVTSTGRLRVFLEASSLRGTLLRTLFAFSKLSFGTWKKISINDSIMQDYFGFFLIAVTMYGKSKSRKLSLSFDIVFVGKKKNTTTFTMFFLPSSINDDYPCPKLFVSVDT